MQQLNHLKLDDLFLFSRVAELGTLSAAARERDIPVSQVTRTLNRIETDCGVRLLHRTTHGLSLTDEGDTFLAYCRQMQDQMAELSSELSGKISGPSGWVRVSASALIAQAVLGPSLMGLYASYPDLRIDINADDRMADMARDGIDIAIRSGELSSDTMVAKQLGVVQRSLYASPAYLAKAGTPTMGGFIILASLMIPVLLFARLDNVYIILLIVATLWTTMIGFADDYIKVFKKDKEGWMRLSASSS